MREMKDSGITSIGLIPSSWRVRKFKTLAKLCNGKEISSDEGNIPVYGSGGVFKYTNVPLHSGESLLMGRKGTIDNPMLVNGDFWTVDTMFYTSEFYDVIGKFLFYCCKGTINYGLYKSGSVLPSMTQTDINNIGLPYTSIEEQRQIVAVLDEKCPQVDTLIANVQAQIEKLKAYKQSLITEVVTKGLDPTVPMKDSGVEWLGKVPQHWEVYRIANLYAERSESGLPELPLLTVSINTGVSDHEVDDADKGRVFIRMEDRTKYKRVCPGDLTYNMMRAWQGAFGAVRVNGLVSPAYVVAKPKNEIPLDSRYIEALLRTPVAIEEMHRYSRGIIDFRLRLYWPEFKNIQICLPPLDEQTRIADYIDEIASKVDSLIAIKQAKIEKLEQYKRSLIYEYVTGKREVI